MRELSWLAILLGVVIGAFLAAANAYVGLKVGLTIGASIPAAVVSLLIMRALFKRSSLLESNMVQTIGSAGQSVATGMIFTLPALFILGSDPQYLQMIVWGGIGGVLGVCFMVPLRHLLIVKEAALLPYPEGVACAEVLQSGERGGSGVKSILWGGVVGAGYYLLSGLGFWKESAVLALRRMRTEAQLDASPALLGIGYIVGLRIAATMLAGAVLSWFILIPGVSLFGERAQATIYPETARRIAQMSPHDIYESYIRYIGAGAVAIGGLLALFKGLPAIAASVWRPVTGLVSRGRASVVRTEKDFPIPLLLLIVAGVVYAMRRFDVAGSGWIGLVVVVVLAFVFVTVSARLVGIVGSSSLAVSGVAVATLAVVAVVYKVFVLDRASIDGALDLKALKVSCFGVGAMICIAMTIGGDTSQDLKTGFLVKATPYKQQIGEVLGVITSVLAVSGLLLLLNKTNGFTPDRPDALPAFQANMMKILVDGVLGGQMPWTLFIMGGSAAVAVELLGLPALPFAIGMYLPLGVSAPIMVGGLVRWTADRKRAEPMAHEPGVLTASGLVAGVGLMGVAFAVALALIAWLGGHPLLTQSGHKVALPLSGVVEPISYAHFVPWLWSTISVLPTKWGLSDAWWDALPALPFAVLVIWLWWCARKRPPITLPTSGVPAAQPPAPTSPSIEPPTSEEKTADHRAESSRTATPERDSQTASQGVEPTGQTTLTLAEDRERPVDVLGSDGAMAVEKPPRGAPVEATPELPADERRDSPPAPETPQSGIATTEPTGPPEPTGQRGTMEFDTQIGTDSDWPELQEGLGQDPSEGTSREDLDAESHNAEHRPDPSDSDDERF